MELWNVSCARTLCIILTPPFVPTLRIRWLRWRVVYLVFCCGCFILRPFICSRSMTIERTSLTEFAIAYIVCAEYDRFMVVAGVASPHIVKTDRRPSFITIYYLPLPRNRWWASRTIRLILHIYRLKRIELLTPNHNWVVFPSRQKCQAICSKAIAVSRCRLRFR